MSSTSLENKIKTILQELHPDIETVLHVEDYVGKIHVFFARFPSEVKLESDWEKLSNTIAMYYQSQLDSEFEIWNLYLFYVVGGDIERHIKYKIENDTVSSRKIVLVHDDAIDEDFINFSIEEHITNKNLHLLPPEKSAASQKTEFVKNENIWDAILESGLLTDKKGESLGTSLDLLEQKLKQNEI